MALARIGIPRMRLSSTRLSPPADYRLFCWQLTYGHRLRSRPVSLDRHQALLDRFAGACVEPLPFHLMSVCVTALTAKSHPSKNKTRVCTLCTHTRVSSIIDILTIGWIHVKHGKRSVSKRSPILWVGRSLSNSCHGGRRSDAYWCTPLADAWDVTASTQA